MTIFTQDGVNPGLHSQLLTNGTFFSDLDLFLLSQRKNKINAFQIISRMKAVHSLRWTLNRMLKKYKDLFGFLLSAPLGFLLAVVGAMAKVRGGGIEYLLLL